MSPSLPSLVSLHPAHPVSALAIARPQQALYHHLLSEEGLRPKLPMTISSIPTSASAAVTSTSVDVSLPAACASLLSLALPRLPSLSSGTVIGDTSPARPLLPPKKSRSSFWATVMDVDDDGEDIDTNKRELCKVSSGQPALGDADSSVSCDNIAFDDDYTNGENVDEKDHRHKQGCENRNNFSRQARSTQSTAPMPSDASQMNIPCVLCGVRFRKPGHLNMHWRSVHASYTDAAYPGSFAFEQPTQAPSLGRAAASSATRSRAPVVPRSPSPSHSGSPSFSAAATTSAGPSVAISKPGHAYGCPQCSACFRRGSDRNRHLRMVHERRRPFGCAQCPKQFGRKSFLEAHVLTVHEKRRPFGCDQCGAAFGQRSSLTRHARKIHGVSM
jgi:uncharacterized C2H2 Zn-finger protein